MTDPTPTPVVAEQPMSEPEPGWSWLGSLTASAVVHPAELRTIESAHQPVGVRDGAGYDPGDLQCASDLDDWPCQTVRLLAALRSEREARGRVEAALHDLTSLAGRLREGDSYWTATGIDTAVTVLRAALTSTEGTSTRKCGSCGTPDHYAGDRTHPCIPAGTSKSEEAGS